MLDNPHPAHDVRDPPHKGEGKAAPRLTLSGISKSFPGVRALHDVSLSLYPGQVTALIGENGAGKSTLVKIMTGIYQPDAGTISIDGQTVTLPSAHAAFGHGVTAIHQETVLFDDLTVAENIFLGHAPRTRFGTIDWRTMRKNAREVLDTMHAGHIGADARLKDLLDWRGGTYFSVGKLWDQIRGWRLADGGYDFEIPLTFVQGELDLQTPSALVTEAFAKLRAPKKELVVIEGAGHTALVTDADAAKKALLNKVLPLVKAAGRPARAPTGRRRIGSSRPNGRPRG